MVAGAPKRDVINYTKVVRGVDGNDIQLYISEPKEHGPVPCVIHLHGGEFSMLSATNGFYTYLRERYVRVHLFNRCGMLVSWVPVVKLEPTSIPMLM
jgi:acetyl esterase/lipase